MKRKRRRAIWISFLLSGVLSIGNMRPIWANEESEVIRQELDEPANEVSTDTVSVSDAFGEEVGIQDMVLGQGDEEDVELKNDPEIQPVCSDDSLSLNSISGNERTIASENQAEDTKVHEKMFNVVLPTEISCDMILWGEERIKGAIRSKRFYMENKGYEDIRISIQGFCSGLKNERYVFKDASVEHDIVQGNKNVWIYLKWENENGEELEYPGIVMGDVSDPGKGEIVLKAPKRGDEGDIQGEDPSSKIYFSFFGDINSDTGSIWEDGELELELEWAMEEVSSGNVVEMPGQLEDMRESEDISDSDGALREHGDILDDEEVSEEFQVISDSIDAPEDVSDNWEIEDHRKESVSENAGETDMQDLVISYN